MNETFLRSRQIGATRLAPTDVLVTPSIDLGDSLRAALAGAWRQRFAIGFVTAICAVLGVLYALTAQPLFTASASLVIDPRISGAAGEPSAPMLLLSDQLLVDSEVKVLQSRDLSDRLVDRLGLLQGTEEAAPADGTAGLPVGAVAPGDDPTERRRAREEARRQLVRPLSIERSGDTYVVDIAYTAPDPAFAARVVNGLIEEYFLAQAAASLDNARRVNDWLDARIDVVAADVATADAAVEAYRQENDLYRSGDVLPSTVELRVTNDQLIATRTEILDLTAQVAQLETAIAQGNVNIAVREGESLALRRLRETFSQAREREQQLTRELSPGHELVAKARADQERTRALILEELGNTAEQLKARIATLRLEEERTRARIDDLEARESAFEAKSIHLRELEREAQSKRRLYEGMLEQLNETSEQTTFATTPARIIASAVPPSKKSAPDTTLILTLALFGGVVLGSGIAFLREALNDAFLLADDVPDELGLPLIGLAPRVDDDRLFLQQASSPMARLKAALKSRARRELGRATFAADNPQSMYAETLRALDMRLQGSATGATGAAAASAVDAGGAAAGAAGRTEPGLVVGFTSAQKGEGKTTLAANFAAMKAGLGYRVVVVDLDMRAAGLTALTAQKSRRGAALGPLMDDPRKVSDLMRLPSLRGAGLISAGDAPVMLADPRILRALNGLLARLRGDFDYTILDLPPLNGLVDASIVAPLADKMVLAIEWGRTRKSHAVRLMADDLEGHHPFVGAIYTRVPLNAYASYNGSSIRDYYTY